MYQYLYSFSSDLDPHNFEEFRTGSVPRAVLLIRKEFITDPDPAFKRNADRIRILKAKPIRPMRIRILVQILFERLDFSFLRLISGNYQDSGRVFPLHQFMVKTLPRYREGEK
jgi:hypothetical protein